MNDRWWIINRNQGNKLAMVVTARTRNEAKARMREKMGRKKHKHTRLPASAMVVPEAAYTRKSKTKG